MTTFKSFTDLEQSKKLAEILPIESADMLYQSYEDDESLGGKWAAIPKNHPLNIGYNDDIPCWSLVALLGYLSAYFRTDVQSSDNCWELDYRVRVAYSKELIDACYEMILKLNEAELL